MSISKNRGEKNVKNKLSRDDVIFIFTCADKTQDHLAEQFNVSQSTINHIKCRRTWKWLTDKISK